MTPQEFLADFCKRTGAQVNACGGSGEMTWPAVAEIVAFAYRLASKRPTVKLTHPDGSVKYGELAWTPSTGALCPSSVTIEPDPQDNRKEQE